MTIDSKCRNRKKAAHCLNKQTFLSFFLQLKKRENTKSCLEKMFREIKIAAEVKIFVKLKRTEIQQHWTDRDRAPGAVAESQKNQK